MQGARGRRLKTRFAISRLALVGFSTVKRQSFHKNLTGSCAMGGFRGW